MAKICFTLCGLTLAVALLNPQARGQNWTGPRPDIETALVRSNLTCTQTSKENDILVPPERAEQARLKARLLSLLRASLYDDAKETVNIAREKEIRKLANKLEHNQDWLAPSRFTLGIRPLERNNE